MQANKRMKLFDPWKNYEIISSSSTALRLYCENGDSVDLGIANPKSDIIYVRRGKRVYVGTSYWNPACFDENGLCVELRSTGVSFRDLVTILSHPEKYDTGLFSPPENRTAVFEYLPVDDDQTMCIRLSVGSLFAGTPLRSYKVDLELHEFIL